MTFDSRSVVVESTLDNLLSPQLMLYVAHVVCHRSECRFRLGERDFVLQRGETKTYSVSIKTGEQERLMDFQKTPEFKAKARERYKIEAKNAELKHVYGYDRAESYGLYSMQMQGAVTIFAANVKRILKLI